MQYTKSTGGSIFSPVIQDRIVPGYYTSTTVDTQGHIVNKNGMLSALEDYRQWGGIREMHDKPIGVIDSIGEPHWNAIKARVVNTARGDEVLQFVREGVYKAFSIGALVTDARLVPFKDISDSLFIDVPPGIVRSIKEYGYIIEIMELVLVEVSIVDRPANPVARISEVKNFSGVDSEELPSIDNLTGSDVFKGVFPVKANKFAVNWDGTSEHSEVALDIDTEEKQVMNENDEVVADETVVTVDTATVVEVVAEEVVDAGDDEAKVAEVELSVDATEPVAADVDVADNGVQLSLERVENMIATLADTLVKAIESLRSDLANAEKEVSTETTEKSVAVSDELVDAIAARVQEKIVAPRKGVVQTIDDVSGEQEPQSKSLKSLGLDELRNRIVTTLAQSSK